MRKNKTKILLAIFLLPNTYTVHPLSPACFPQCWGTSRDFDLGTIHQFFYGKDLYASCTNPVPSPESFFRLQYFNHCSNFLFWFGNSDFLVSLPWEMHSLPVAPIHGTDSLSTRSWCSKKTFARTLVSSSSIPKTISNHQKASRLEICATSPRHVDAHNYISYILFLKSQTKTNHHKNI